MAFAWMLLLATGPAGALVIVEHVVPDPWSVTFGQTFQVPVRLRWDGQGSLLGVFTSTLYDSSVLEFVSATTPPLSILSYVDDQGTPGDPGDDEIHPGLFRFLNPSIINGALRTVQFGAGSVVLTVDGRAATTGAGRLITTLTFRMIGPGSFFIRGGLAQGDAVIGDSVMFVNTPEPGTSLLLGIGLTGMALRRSRRASVD